VGDAGLGERVEGGEDLRVDVGHGAAGSEGVFVRPQRGKDRILSRRGELLRKIFCGDFRGRFSPGVRPTQQGAGDGLAG